MEGRGKPRNLDNFATVNRRIFRTGLWNLAKFSVANCGGYSSFTHTVEMSNLHI